ncbi:unnamed protein product [Cuscuta campestris]|uniref:HTH myb-type domain-containing protein n=1 Tax=Cuscuta campestris TaxID=132261 RepID=A0A484MWR4_9ASTE|nr:unnamed protein product [Cuscuta campestris]
MDLPPNLQNKESKNLILSSDPKPRLKWTPELHQLFVAAVTQLGGAEKATPKGLMRVMNIHGLTLYHLKSHLQKFRLGKSQQLQSSCHDKNQSQDYQQSLSQESQSRSESSDGAQHQMNESMKIAEALQMQMEVQKKLQEQIKVQRQLQMRIEAQGKYLQTVMKKAHEALSKYTPCSSSQAELSSLTELGCVGCSQESSLTSSESSGNHSAELLPLMEMQPGQKRNRSMVSSVDADNTCLEKNSLPKRMGFLENIDLNVKCVKDFDT